MRTRSVLLAVALLMPTLALAGPPCEIPGYLLYGNNDLKRVTASVKDGRRLTVAVIGTGSSALAGPEGPASAYPARLEAALKQHLPGLAVNPWSGAARPRTIWPREWPNCWSTRSPIW